MTVLCTNLPMVRAFLRRQRITGGWSSHRTTSFRAVQWNCGENSRNCDEREVNNHLATRIMPWSRWGSGQENFGKLFVEREDLLEVCGAPLNGWIERASGWMLTQFLRFCWRRSWRVAENCVWLWKLVFPIQSWKETTFAQILLSRNTLGYQ